jgi:hypothetical protein
VIIRAESDAQTAQIFGNHTGTILAQAQPASVAGGQ